MTSVTVGRGTDQSFRVCKVILATLKVATKNGGSPLCVKTARHPHCDGFVRRDRSLVKRIVEKRKSGCVETFAGASGCVFAVRSLSLSLKILLVMETCTGILRDTRKLKRVSNSLRLFPWFLGGETCCQTPDLQVLHPDYRQSTTGNVVVSHCDMRHDAIVLKHNEKTIQLDQQHSNACGDAATTMNRNLYLRLKPCQTIRVGKLRRKTRDWECVNGPWEKTVRWRSA